MVHFIKKILLPLLCLVLLVSAHGQEQFLAATIHPMELSVTNLETSVLVFPAAIKSVDRGSKEILSKVVKDITNVLKLKASGENMAPTNLHVFTADGKVYAFSVKYSKSPSNLTIDFTIPHATGRTSSRVKFAGQELNDAAIERFSQAILGLKPHQRGPHSPKIGKSFLRLNGAYLKKGVLFFQLSIKNNAKMPYQADFIRCYIRDQRKTKRASVTEQEILPLFTKMDTTSAIPGKPISFVLAFDQFTIADGKFLAIEAFEKNGDRVLTCKLKGKHLLKVRKLPL